MTVLPEGKSWEMFQLRAKLMAILVGPDLQSLERTFFACKDPCIKDLDQLEDLAVDTAKHRANKILNSLLNEWRQKNNLNGGSNRMENGDGKEPGKAHLHTQGSEARL